MENSPILRRSRSRLATVVLVSLVSVCGAKSLLRSDEPVKATKWTPELMMQVKRIGSVQVSPDGKLVAFTVRQPVMEDGKSEYRTHIHAATAGAEGKKTWQLTQGDKSCDDPQWSPDGSTIAFISSRSGKSNLWLIRAAGGEAQQLTDLKSNVSSFQWSPNGENIAFTAPDALTAEEERADRDKDDARVVDAQIKRQRLHVITVNSLPSNRSPPRALTSGERNVASDATRPGRPAFSWSTDSQTIVFSHTRSPSPDDWPSADLSLVDLPSGSVRRLVQTAAAESSPHFSPDGKWIAYVASDFPPTWAGRKRIHVISVSGDSPRALAATDDDFGRYSELLGWNTDGSQVYFTELQGTVLKLMKLPLNGSPVTISQIQGMSLGGFFLNVSRRMVGFGWETLSEPCEVWISPLDSFSPRRVSRVHNELAAILAPKSEVIRWNSTDGFEVEGLLTYPNDDSRGKRAPLLVIIHGGPMGAFTQSCDAAPNTYPVAAFAARGYAVLRANIRGSSGYGAKFRYANYGDWGGGDFRDLMAGVDRLIEQGIADPDRLGVMGWSYGGYLTSWTITQTPRFRAASVGAGVTNLVSFTGTADIPGFLPDYFGAEFWDQLEPYRAHSAMFHARGVRTPTLIQHGERDERVPLSQSQELYNALKRQGCTTQMVVYPRTPHAIEEPRLLLDCMRRNVEWFDTHVGNAAACYTIRRTNVPIKVDGRLDEVAWQVATAVGDFQFPWWREGDQEQTAAKLLWNDEYLYLSFRCQDAHISAEHTQRDSPVYQDDCVELFTAPNADQPRDYFNIEMNVRGAFLDQHRPDGPGNPATPDWNASGITIATSIDGTLNDDTDRDRSWVLETAIPLANFQDVAKNTPPRSGDVWHLNLNRLGGKTNSQYSQWSPGKTDRPQFHAPQYFGRVVFSDKP